jgi:plasmid maintenance system killer protein
MLINDPKPEVVKKLNRYSLLKKFSKAKKLFEQDIKHPSLNVELLEPRELRIYSFRIDRKYRASFTIDSGKAKVLDITLHYQCISSETYWTPLGS